MPSPGSARPEGVVAIEGRGEMPGDWMPRLPAREALHLAPGGVIETTTLFRRPVDDDWESQLHAVNFIGNWVQWGRASLAVDVFGMPS